MIFETLWESAQRGELVLTTGGLCHFHLRRDGQLTIREIIVLPEFQGLGAGTEMLKILQKKKGVKSIFAKCPVELEANEWYRRKGFALEGTETTKTGRELNLWRLSL
jgi:GNAT superfamily N-acetyltransferase